MFGIECGEFLCLSGCAEIIPETSYLVLALCPGLGQFVLTHPQDWLLLRFEVSWEVTLKCQVGVLAVVNFLRNGCGLGGLSLALLKLSSICWHFACAVCNVPAVPA